MAYRWKIAMVMAGVLAACSGLAGPDKAKQSVSITAVTASEPQKRFWISADTQSSTWQGGQTGGGSDILRTKAGKFAILPQGMILKDNANRNVGEVLGYRLGQPAGTSGRGHIFETGTAFNWKVI